MKTHQLKQRDEQEARVSKLNERRQSTLLLVANLKQETVTISGQLADLEKKLKNATEQRQRLLDLGGDEKKIQTYQNEAAALEEQGFDLLTRQDEIESEIAEHKTFLQGLDKTIQEITAEAQPEVLKINTEVTNIELRLRLLLEELPDDFRILLQKISAKNLAHGPFTRIEQGSCYFCRYKISRLDESEIDMQKNLKTCPQCSRIFLPYGA